MGLQLKISEEFFFTSSNLRNQHDQALPQKTSVNLFNCLVALSQELKVRIIQQDIFLSVVHEGDSPRSHLELDVGPSLQCTRREHLSL
jgi:hypothetical protein